MTRANFDYPGFIFHEQADSLPTEAPPFSKIIDAVMNLEGGVNIEPTHLLIVLLQWSGGV